jgi:hypothetical protein
MINKALVTVPIALIYPSKIIFGDFPYKGSTYGEVIPSIFTLHSISMLLKLHMFPR